MKLVTDYFSHDKSSGAFSAGAFSFCNKKLNILKELYISVIRKPLSKI